MEKKNSNKNKNNGHKKTLWHPYKLQSLTPEKFVDTDDRCIGRSGEQAARSRKEHREANSVLNSHFRFLPKTGVSSERFTYGRSR